jgi:hypothetical protein
MATLVTGTHEEINLTWENLPAGERVILNTSQNLSFAGILRGRLSLDEEEGILVRLEDKTHFTIWCPFDHVNRLIIVPMD